MNVAHFLVKNPRNVAHSKNVHHLIMAPMKNIISKLHVVYLKHQFLQEDVTFREHHTEERLIFLEATKLHLDRVILYQVSNRFHQFMILILLLSQTEIPFKLHLHVSR